MNAARRPLLEPVVYLLDADPSVRDALTLLLEGAGFFVQAFSTTTRLRSH